MYEPHYLLKGKLMPKVTRNGKTTRYAYTAKGKAAATKAKSKGKSK